MASGCLFQDICRISVAMGSQITTIGNLTIDDIILFDEKEMFLGSIGGNVLFSAVGARIWDAEPTIRARKGRSFPESSIQRLERFGIKADLVAVPKNDIRDWALYEPGGDRQFINHLSSGSHHDMSITGDDLGERNLKSDGVHVASMPTDVQYSLLEKVQQKKEVNTVVSLDPHVEYLEKEELRKLAFEMLKYVDVFLPSSEEVEKMFGSDRYEDAARAFADAGPEVVAIKKNVEGSLIYLRGQDKFYDVPIFACDAIDPTGAGDAYCGGFLACFSETEDPMLAAAYGTVSASYVVEHVGALSTLEADFEDKGRRLESVTQNITEL